MYCSVQDNFTGPVPNTHWGHGKLDSYAVMIGCNALGINQNTPMSYSAFPNPIENQLNIQLRSGNQPTTVRLINAIGQEVYANDVIPGAETIVIPRGNLANGLYLLTIKVAGKTENQRIVFE